LPGGKQGNRRKGLPAFLVRATQKRKVVYGEERRKRILAGMPSKKKSASGKKKGEQL